MADDATLKIGVEATQAKAEVNALQSAFGKLGDAIKNPTASIASMATGFAAGYVSMAAVTQAGQALLGFLTDSVKEFADAEAASKKLDVALKQQGQTLPGTRDGYDKLAKELQRTTVFSDDLVTEMQALFVQVGNVGPAQMGKALRAATDLSAGLGMDLKASTLLVAKAFAGGGEELGRLKQILGDTIPEGASMEQVLDAINAKFGGQAQAQIETYGGKIAQLKNNWNDVKESTGGIIAETGILSAVMFALRFKLAETEAGMSALTRTQQLASAGLPPHIAALHLLAGGHDEVTAAVLASETPMEAFSRVNDAARAKMAALRDEAEKLRTQGVTPLSAEQRDLVRAFDAGGVAAGEIAKKLGVSSAAVSKLLTDEKAATTESRKLAEAFQKQVDVLTGQALADKVADLNRQVVAAGKDGGVTAFEYQRLGKELASLREQGASLPPTLHSIWLEHERLNPSIKVNTDVYKGLDSILKALPPSVVGLQKPIALLQQEFARTISTDPYAILNRLGTTVIGLQQPFQGALDKAKALNAGIEAMSGRGASARDVLREYGDAAVQAAIDLVRMGGSLDQLPPKLREVAEEAVRTKEKLDLADKIDRIGQTVSAVGGMIGAEIGGRWGEAMSLATNAFGSGAKSIASFMSGDIAGGIQAGVAAVLSFGKAVAQVFGNDTKKAREEFASGMNMTLDELMKKLQASGAKGQELANQALNVIGKHDEAGNKRWMNEVTAFFSSHQQQLEDERALLDEATLSWEDAEAIAKEFGITTANSGKMLEQAKIAEQGENIAVKWRKATLAGMDFKDVTTGMSDEVQELINRSNEMGIDLPASLKKPVEEMIKLGLLTDANGEKITDMGAIRFSETPMDKLITKLDELLTKIFGVGDTSVEANRKSKEAFDKARLSVIGVGEAIDRLPYEVPIRIKWEAGEFPGMPGGSGGGSGGGIPEYDTGSDGIQNFGPGTLAMLHGYEGVFTAKQIAGIVNQAARYGAGLQTSGMTFAAGSTSAQPVVVNHVTVDASGSMFRDRRAMDELADILSDRIAGKYRQRAQVGVL